MICLYCQHWDDTITLELPTPIDCDYLPSLHDNISCFYKPITCDSPPDVANNTKILNSKDVYQLHGVVQYACVNDTFKMKGNKSVSCLYSGEWSTLPTCEEVKQEKNSLINIVYIGLPILLLFLFILMFIVGIKRKNKASSDHKEEKIESDNTLAQFTENEELLSPSKRKQDSTLLLESLPLLKRNRQFDAFVLYHFDTDDDFVVHQLVPELEEIRSFKLCIHSRNFTPGRGITDNIEEAIEDSNSAIIVMSQGFVDSIWCKEEFTHCYIENMKDPSFSLFVIMMQPADTLINVSPCMKIFFANKTYLQINDPQLFTKLATRLDHARKEKDADNDNNEQITSQEEQMKDLNLFLPHDETLEVEETSV